MWKSNNNFVLNINISENNIIAVLTNGESQMADFSFVTPRNDFRKFITILKALVRASEDVARDKGVVIKELLFNIFADHKIIDERIINCKRLPVLNKVNLSDFLVEYRGKMLFNYVESGLRDEKGVLRERLNVLMRRSSQEVL